ncbi:hypothetical protein MACH17_18510 [Phaeobacter inhibens]|uniref:hypothetical protein n=1 Tax=Phaeobacter inhibens TaxID=221822 RepID=UPI002745DC1B|nr:hypothetical protein [Phaeobacter inhibens]GLO70334.1 hypothetical protein MACH17_18510 [Phaeobacter inhibens]
MLNRRGILRLIGGGVAAGATVDPKMVVREAAARGGLASGALLGGSNEPCGAPVPGRDPVDDLLMALYDHSTAVDVAHHRMPPHISSKKSWSASFKQSEAYKEAMAELQARRNMERNRSFAEKIAKSLGFG